MGALELAFYDVQRAVDYLTSGIPPQVMAARRQQATHPGNSQAPAPAPAPAPAAQDEDLFAELKTMSKFMEWKTQLQADPKNMVKVLKEIAQDNPKVLKVIAQNRSKFLAMMQDTGTPAPSPSENIEAMTSALGIPPAHIAQMLSQVPASSLGSLAQR